MPDGAVVLFFVGPVVLLLCLVLAQLAGTGAIQRNSAIGIRTRATLSSDDAWEAGHLAARGPALIGVIVLVLAGIGALLLPVAAAWTVVETVGYAVLLGGFIAWVAVGANRAARAADPARSQAP